MGLMVMVITSVMLTFDLMEWRQYVMQLDVSVCVTRVGGKGQLLAGAGRCVRGLVKVTQLRVYYTRISTL